MTDVVEFAMPFGLVVNRGTGMYLQRLLTVRNTLRVRA